MDLEAGDLLETGVDTVAIGDRLVERYDELWDALTGRRVLRRRRPLARRGPDRARSTTSASTSASSTSSRTSTARPCASSPRSSTPATTARRLMRLTGLDVRGEPGAPAAQRPRRLPRRDRPAGRGRGVRRARLAHRRLRAGRARGARASCAASSSRRRCSTRCSTTGGSSRASRTGTCRCVRRRPQLRGERAAPPTGREGSARRGHRRRSRRWPRRARRGPPTPADCPLRPSCPRSRRHLVQRDACGDPGVERLDRCRRSGSTRPRRRSAAPAGRAPCPPSRPPAPPGRSASCRSPTAHRARRRRARRRSSPASRSSPSARTRLVTRATGTRAAAPADTFHADGGHPGRATLGHHDAVRAERAGRAQHRAEVAGVGHAVQRDDERRLPGPLGAGRAGRPARCTRTAAPASRRPGAARPSVSRSSSGWSPPAAAGPLADAIWRISRIRSSASIGGRPTRPRTGPPPAAPRRRGCARRRPPSGLRPGSRDRVPAALRCGRRRARGRAWRRRRARRPPCAWPPRGTAGPRPSGSGPGPRGAPRPCRRCRSSRPS